MRELNPVIFNTIPKPIPMTARELGCQLACDSCDKQASILCQWQKEIESWRTDGKVGGSWPMQCRMIAEQMTNAECAGVASMLDTLVEHLNAIPRERNQQQAESVAPA